MLSNEKKQIPETATVPGPGCFLIENAWEKCRDSFARFFSKDTTFFVFSHAADIKIGEAIASFIAKVEKILEVEQSSFCLTNRPYALWIEPSSFWKKCIVRRSLFSALLRAGQQYNPNVDNFEQALYSDVYTAQTKNAVMRFLFGFTKFNEEEARRLLNFNPTPANGWYCVFNGINGDVMKLRRILVSPDEQQQKVLIGVPGIWN